MVLFSLASAMHETARAASADELAWEHDWQRASTAYGNALNPSETTALVRFLATLRGNDLAPAIDASRHLTVSSEGPATPPTGH